MKNAIFKILGWEPDFDFEKFFDFKMSFSVPLFKFE